MRPLPVGGASEVSLEVGKLHFDLIACGPSMAVRYAEDPGVARDALARSERDLVAARRRARLGGARQVILSGWNPVHARSGPARTKPSVAAGTGSGRGLDRAGSGPTHAAPCGLQ